MNVTPASNPTPTSQPPLPLWKKHLPLLAGIAVAAVILGFFLYLQSRPTEQESPYPSLPPASTPPSAPLPLEQQDSVHRFSWSAITSLPPTTTPRYLYRLLTPIINPSSAPQFATTLGFSPSDLVSSNNSQWVYSSDYANLSLGTSPTYLSFVVRDLTQSTTPLSSLQARFQDFPTLSISSPASSTQPVRNPIDGTTTNYSVNAYTLTQTIDTYPLATNSGPLVGTILVDQDTNQLFSLHLHGGYSQIEKMGSAPEPTLDNLIARADSAAIYLSQDQTIGSTRAITDNSQSISITSLQATYYHNPNSSYLTPGFLLEGTNQDGLPLTYFVPSL